MAAPTPIDWPPAVAREHFEGALAVERKMERARIRAREWWARNPERTRASAKKYRQTEKYKVRARQRLKEKIAAHPERFAKYRKTSNLRRQTDPSKRRHFADNGRRLKYGLSPEKYDAMVLASEGLCGICGEVGESKARYRHGVLVDHDHNTGEVRGLLCSNCNLAISYLEKHGRVPEEWFAKASAYIQRRR